MTTIDEPTTTATSPGLRPVPVAVRPAATYPRDHWYVVASSSEVGRHLLARTVCGEHLVLYRAAAGQAVALRDRCSHRGYPLSAGAIVGDEIQCGYHGLRFDARGTCTWAPGQDRIPSRADVAARPVVERAPWIWVWMGDPERPDHTRLPDVPWFGDDRWSVVDGMEPIDAPYGLLVDNLLDLSHETFLHAGSIGTPEVAETPFETTVDPGDVVRVVRRMASVECPPFYERTTGLRTPIDRWQDIEYFAPGFYLLHVRVAPAGLAPSGDDAGAAHVKVFYALTPCDDHRTLDFWAVGRDFAVDDPSLDVAVAEMNRNVVLQDVACLNLIAERAVSETTPDEVSFKIDAGGLAARRVLQAQIARERRQPGG